MIPGVMLLAPRHMAYHNQYLSGNYTDLTAALESSHCPHELLLLAKCYLYTDQLDKVRELLPKIAKTSEEAHILLQLIAFLDHAKEVTHPGLAKAIQWINTPIPESKAYTHPMILALGSPTDEQGRPRTRLQRTLVKTKAVWDTFQLPIMVTGGAVRNTFVEAQVMKNWLEDHGVTSPIITETESMNTVQNFQKSVPFIKALAVDHLHVITADFHVNRAKRIGHQILPGIGFTFYGVNNPQEHTLHRVIIERYATYRDVTRIMGLWH